MRAGQRRYEVEAQTRATQFHCRRVAPALGEKHRLVNPGKIPAFLIAVQSGSYLDEDDIVRFEDVYGRQGD
jgi:hypothetical protein